MKVDLQGRRARPVRQRAPALHRLEGAQRGAARVRRCGAGCTSPSTGSSTTRPARRCAARPRRRSTSGSGSPGSRPSCARAAASSRRRAEAAPGCRELIELERPARRPALPHDAVRRPPDARGDGGGGARARATSTSRSPTTRPSTGSATTSRPRRCAARIERDPRAQRAARRDRAARRHRGQHPPRRLARLRRRAARAARLGDRVRPHLVRDGRAGDDRPHDRARSSTRWSTRSATRRGARSRRAPPYALDIERVIEAAARTGTMLEINAAPGPPRPQRDPRPRGGARPAC